MLIRLILLFGCFPMLTFAATQNLLSPLRGDHFTDSAGDMITYACTAGGHPLVVYAFPPHNQQPIASQKPIYPSYVEQGFTASALQISDAIQTPDHALNNLIIKSVNPGILCPFGKAV